jgi:hypothetical protein
MDLSFHVVASLVLSVLAAAVFFLSEGMLSAAADNRRRGRFDLARLDLAVWAFLCMAAACVTFSAILVWSF